MGRADRRRAHRTTPRHAPRAQPAAASSLNLAAYLGEGTQLLARAAFAVLAGVFLITLARALEARITWYLAVDQFGYLQFANDLLRGKVFHDWEPARIMGILPKRTDVLAQTYVWDNGQMYCRYSPGFPMLVAGWLALFGEARVSFLNPTLFLIFLGIVMACEWRLSGSIWRGLVVAVLITLCPTMMYWWSLTLTRDLSAHFFAFIGLYQLIPRPGQPLTLRRAVVAGLALGFAGSIRNDAVLYLLPASLLAGMGWLRERPATKHAAQLAGAAAAGLVLGLLPTLAYNAMTTGNPLRPTQGMEIEQFLSERQPAPTFGGKGPAYPSLWKGGTVTQVQGGGLRLENFRRTAPAEWSYIFAGYGWVLIGLAGLGALVALVRRPALFLFAVPYLVSAFLFYSCWSRPDRRYIIGLFSIVPFLITEGVFGSLDLLGTMTKRRGESVGRAIAGVVAVVALVLVVAPIPMPPLTGDATYLSKGALPVLTTLLPLALGLGAVVVAVAPAQPVTQVLAPALALVLAGYGIARADATRAQRAPFQRPQVVLARETMRLTLEPRSFVITSEDMGRPAENIEQWGGFPAFYLTDLDRWKISPSEASLSFISAGVRPYLLVDREVPQRGRALADLAKNGFKADLVLEIPAAKNMEYFIATPTRRNVNSELFRISHPEWERLLRETGIRP